MGYSVVFANAFEKINSETSICWKAIRERIFQDEGKKRGDSRDETETRRGARENIKSRHRRNPISLIGEKGAHESAGKKALKRGFACKNNERRSVKNERRNSCFEATRVNLMRLICSAGREREILRFFFNTLHF